MGLVISYQFELKSATVEQARSKIVALRKLASKLPFATIDQLVELEGKDCKFDGDDIYDPNIFLKIRAMKPVKMADDGFEAISSKYMIAFDTLPGEGAETAAFGLATHTEITEANQVSDWIWHGFCKTQYASNPEYGGIKNFLKCHLMLVRMLDEAQKLGIVHKVSDDSGYWKERDVKELAYTIHHNNVMMAALTGQLKDGLNTKEFHAPIFEYPNFEYLEAEGN
ncbi:hypothetical protein NIES4071_22820 [Calothrix sp. NIES-4071]|nr:hypothetical protein NIES4071_22820 [Calothrix sp. NIES-4071]BAZ56613.1 hypothetical protein NIES4105_22770 [Calothrix sp. NIES-4105]